PFAGCEPPGAGAPSVPVGVGAGPVGCGVGVVVGPSEEQSGLGWQCGSWLCLSASGGGRLSVVLVPVSGSAAAAAGRATPASTASMIAADAMTVRRASGRATTSHASYALPPMPPPILLLGSPMRSTGMRLIVGTLRCMRGYLGSYATLGLLLVVGAAALTGAFGVNRLLRP